MQTYSAKPLNCSFLLTLLLCTACAPSVKYVALAPTGPPRGLTDPVEVYFNDTEIPPGFSVLGEIHIGDTGFSTGCDLDAVVGIAKDKARSVGADAIYLELVAGPDISSTCYRITARVLRYDTAPGVTETAVGSQPVTTAEHVNWRRPAPSADEILYVRHEDRNPRIHADRFERAADAVVRLDGPTGTATGFVITRDGLALTNHHVVENQTYLEASLRDGRRLPVRVLRSDSTADVALVQIDCAVDCFTLDLATMNPRVGADVHVIGNALALDHTLTRGIVSGLRLARGVTLIQTDAALNLGNSGGPIILAETGEVLAVVTWKVAGGTAEGLGFGVSVIDALRVLGIQYQ